MLPKSKLYFLTLILNIFITAFGNASDTAPELWDAWYQGVTNDENAKFTIEAAKTIDVNLMHSVTGTSLTPLMVAAFKGDNEMVQILIDRGAEINKLDDLNGTALSWAKNVETAKLLINAGADINNIPSAPATSVAFGNFDVAMLLVQAGADVNKFENGCVKCSALNTAIKELCYDCLHSDEDKAKLFELIKILFEKSNTEIRKCAFKTACQYVPAGMNTKDVINYNIQVIELFAQNGADIDFSNRKNASLLNEAINHLNLDWVKTLIQSGACPNVIDKKRKKTSIFVAIDSFILAMSDQFYIDYYDLDQDYCDDDCDLGCGNKGLDNIKKSVEIIKFLVECNADTDQKIKNKTPIEYLNSKLKIKKYKDNANFKTVVNLLSN